MKAGEYQDDNKPFEELFCPYCGLTKGKNEFLEMVQEQLKSDVSKRNRIRKALIGIKKFAGDFSKGGAGMIFQAAGMIILLAFYGCYFIKMINQRKRGIQTDQIGKGKTGLVKFIEMTMKIATYLVPVAEIISIILNTTSLPLAVRITGMVIGAFGAAMFIAAVLTMRDSWRAGVSEIDSTELVTSGIYQISRNPAFLGFDLVYIGILLMFFNWALLGLSFFAIIMLHLQIVNVEEDFLITTFGGQYITYRQSVNRYLGRRRIRSSLKI